MAVTMIRKVMGTQPVNLVFKTIERAVDDTTFIALEVYIGDDNLKPKATNRIVELLQSEEQYHTDLRKEAAKAGHLVTSHSTNPEWNPDSYLKTLDEFKKDEESRTKYSIQGR